MRSNDDYCSSSASWNSGMPQDVSVFGAVCELVRHVAASGRHLQFFFTGKIHHRAEQQSGQPLALGLPGHARMIHDDVPLAGMAIGEYGLAPDLEFTAAGRLPVFDLRCFRAQRFFSLRVSRSKH